MRDSGSRSASLSYQLHTGRRPLSAPGLYRVSTVSILSNLRTLTLRVLELRLDISAL